MKKITVTERQSLRRKKAILYLVNNGEYSVGYAIDKVEDLFADGKLIDTDYEELADYLENLLNEPEPVEETKENSEEETLVEEEPTEAE